jgi:hypothetical protein
MGVQLPARLAGALGNPHGGVRKMAAGEMLTMVCSGSEREDEARKPDGCHARGALNVQTSVRRSHRVQA